MRARVRRYQTGLIAAEVLATTASWAQGPPAGPRPHSFWLDPIHLLGIVAPVLMLVALILGLTIIFGLRRHGHGYDSPVRSRRRRWHLAFGLTGGLLAIAHSVGRYYQLGHFNFDRPAPLLALLFVGLIITSGVLRLVTSYRHATALEVWAWVHRVSVVGMLAGAALHTYGAVAFHLARLRAAVPPPPG